MYRVSDYASMFMQLAEADLKPATVSKYRIIVDNYILPAFADRDIRDIRVSDVRLWLSGYKDRSPKTIRDYVGVLSGIFRLALEDDIITKNPCVYVRLPKLSKRHVQPFTPDEVQRIIDAAKPVRFKMYLQIAFYTGMRSGEIIALRVDDIDLANRVISVRRTRGRFGEHSPKTASGVRFVPIIDDLLRPLRHYLADHDHDYLFVTRQGKPYKHNETFSQKFWIPLLRDLGIPRRRLYNTRHTFASMMLRNGVTSPQNIAQILGHSDSQMLHQVYARYLSDAGFGFDLDIDLYA